MIFAEDLTKHFDDFVAVEGIHLDVTAGKCLVLLGPNGAGKTTSLRMLTSVLKPTRGRALVAGFDVVRQAEKVRAAVGVLTEQHGLYGRMNAVEYLTFFGRLYNLPINHLRSRISTLLEHFCLADAGTKRLGEYSKGMRQKLALVRALLHEPPVLLLDEPTSAMDPESARMVRDAITSLRSGNRTILLCTHNLMEAEELADQVAVIRRGRILVNDTPDILKRKMLGAVEYEARLSRTVNGWQPKLPPGVILTSRDETRMRFRIEDPDKMNPQLLRRMLVDDRLEIISFTEVPRSLEQAYLEALKKFAGGGGDA